MNKMNFPFLTSKSKVLITGSTGYLGKKIATCFSSVGCNLILLDLDIKKLKQQKENLTKKYKNKIKIYQCDFSDTNLRDTIFKKISLENKSLDVLINNAAMVGDDKSNKWNVNLKEQSIKNWKKCFTVNLEAVYSLIKILEKNLKQGRNPCIVNVGSIYGSLAPNYEIYKNTKINNPAAYSISKGGLINLTKLFASYLAPKVRVNCLSPGGILRSQSKKFVKNYVSTVPLKRMANESDIVNVILFLSCNMSKYVTGENIIVDGGKSII